MWVYSVYKHTKETNQKHKSRRTESDRVIFHVCNCVWIIWSFPLLYCFTSTSSRYIDFHSSQVCPLYILESTTTMPVKFAYGELSSWLKVKVHRMGPGLCIIECTFDVMCNVYFRSSQAYDYNNMNTGSYFRQLPQVLFTSFAHINYFIIVWILNTRKWTFIFAFHFGSFLCNLCCHDFSWHRRKQLSFMQMRRCSYLLN